MIFKISTNSAPVKKTPTSDAEIIDRIDINTQIDVIELTNRWASFIYNDNTCYINTMYIKKIETTSIDNVETMSINNVEEEEIIAPIVELIEEPVLDTPIIPVTKSIIVRYIDGSSKEDIISPVIYNELPLGNYSYDAAEILGYNLLNSNKEDITLTDESDNLEIVFEYEKILGKVTIKYMDYDIQSEILPEDIFENLDLSNYMFNAKYIDGYFNIESSYNDITLDNYDYEKTISFYYKQLTGIVTIKYVDFITREEIATPTIMDGIKLDNYVFEYKEIDGYMVVGPNSKSITLNESLTNYEVCFEYRLINIDTNQSI